MTVAFRSMYSPLFMGSQERLYFSHMHDMGKPNGKTQLSISNIALSHAAYLFVKFCLVWVG
jgi:hypothetical protein